MPLAMSLNVVALVDEAAPRRSARKRDERGRDRQGTTISNARRAPAGRRSSSSTTRTKSPCRNVCAIARNAAAAQQPRDDVVGAAGRAGRAARMTAAPIITTKIASTDEAGEVRRRRRRVDRGSGARRIVIARSRRRPRSRALDPAFAGHDRTPIGVDDLAAVVARLALPLGEHEVADLAQVGRQLLGGLRDGHALLLELVDVPAVLLLGQLPAARLGVGGRLQHRGLRRLVERVERLLVDDDRVLRQPGLRVVPVLDVLVGLASRSRSRPTTCTSPSTPVASACGTSAAWIVTGCAPTSSAIFAVAGLYARHLRPFMSATRASGFFV